MNNTKNKKVQLDLTTIDGNAFVILGRFSRKAKHANWSQEDINEVLAEARSSDYDHLVATISEYCE
jgi:hypothetical protein